METYHCPSCGKLLNASGELSCAGESLPVFQCDACKIDRGDMFGEVALTFVVDATGRAFNPAHPDELL